MSHRGGLSGIVGAAAAGLTSLFTTARRPSLESQYSTYRVLPGPNRDSEYPESIAPESTSEYVGPPSGADPDPELGLPTETPLSPAVTDLEAPLLPSQPHPQPRPGFGDGVTPPIPPSVPHTDSDSSSRTSGPQRCSILVFIVSGGSYNRKHHINLDRSRTTKDSYTDDKELFMALRKCYYHRFRTARQRYLSLRGLKDIAVIEYTERSSPKRVEIDMLTPNEIMYAFNHPDKFAKETKWVDWVFMLKSDPKKKYGLEFVQGWKGKRIFVLGTIPWLASVLTAILWGAFGGELQVVMAVASFILAASSAILALLAILSALDR